MRHRAGCYSSSRLSIPLPARNHTSVQPASFTGIRAAARKGVFTWLARQRADVVCIQETKAQEHQLEDPMFRPRPFHCFYEDAEKKGYSGVALYARREPDDIVRGYGSPEFDAEGRGNSPASQDFFSKVKTFWDDMTG